MKTDTIQHLKIPFQVTPVPGIKIDRFVYLFMIFGDKITLIDTGIAGSEKLISGMLSDNGRDIKDISTLILSHAHPDHIGSAREIKTLTGCTVFAHRDAAAWIEDTGLQKKERLVPGFDEFVSGSVKVDQEISGNMTIDIPGGPSLEIMHTPGHSSGSISIWIPEEKALFTGDAVPLPGTMPVYDDIVSSILSLRSLQGVSGVEYLLSSWADPMRTSDAGSIFDKGIDHLKSIHEKVIDTHESDPAMPLMELTSKVVSGLGLSPSAANPLVARSFASSIKAYGRTDVKSL